MESYMFNGKQITRKQFFQQLERDEMTEVRCYPYILSANNVIQLSKGAEVKCNNNCYQIIKDKGDDGNEI